MKEFSLLFLRVSTGSLLLVWGVLRLLSPKTGPGLAKKYYGGMASAEWMQTGWGLILSVVGLLCILGLYRKFAYPAQAVILIGGAAVIWKYLVDPLGLWLLDAESRQLLFYPSLCLAAATLVLIAFREFDRWALDVKFAKKR